MAVAETCATRPDWQAWLKRLPDIVAVVAERWALRLGDPFQTGVSAAWVAPATRADGARAVIKVGLPHMEAEHEIAGLHRWAGDGAVRLLEADAPLNAMLLERCEPGTPLRSLPEAEQDEVIAGLLPRLWKRDPGPPFRPLSAMTDLWSRETLARQPEGLDPGLVREGASLMRELHGSASESVLLATDLHAGNVLKAGREPWLMIDPKPFVGDPAYDVTQHLLNCLPRLATDPLRTIDRFAGLLRLDAYRVRLWLFARLATEPRDDWGPEAVTIIRELAP
jgi:streptomycin 6-kinase